MISLSRCVILLDLAPLFQWWVSRLGKSPAPLPFEIHVYCTLVRFPLVALPWSDLVASSFPCCFCGWFLWFFVLSLLRLLCVWSPRGRAGLPLPPFVGWFASVSGPVVCPGVFLGLSCGCPPLWPSHPWRLVVLISGSEGVPSVVSVWISGCFGNGLGVWPVCMNSCLLLTGLEMEICLLPCVFVLYGNKGFGPVWGTALYTMLCLAFVVFGFPLWVGFTWPHDTTPCAVVQRASPSSAHSANLPVCPPLPVLGAPPLLLLFFVCLLVWCCVCCFSVLLSF